MLRIDNCLFIEQIAINFDFDFLTMIQSNVRNTRHRRLLTGLLPRLGKVYVEDLGYCGPSWILNVQNAMRPAFNRQDLVVQETSLY